MPTYQRVINTNDVYDTTNPTTPRYISFDEANKNNIWKGVQDVSSINGVGGTSILGKNPVETPPQVPVPPSNSMDNFSSLLYDLFKRSKGVDNIELLKRQRELQRAASSAFTADLPENLSTLSPAQRMQMRENNASQYRVDLDENAYQLKKMEATTKNFEDVYFEAQKLGKEFAEKIVAPDSVIDAYVKAIEQGAPISTVLSPLNEKTRMAVIAKVDYSKASAKDNKTAIQEEYEYMKSQGYKGTAMQFAQWKARQYGTESGGGGGGGTNNTGLFNGLMQSAIDQNATAQEAVFAAQAYANTLSINLSTKELNALLTTAQTLRKSPSETQQPAGTPPAPFKSQGSGISYGGKEISSDYGYDPNRVDIVDISKLSDAERKRISGQMINSLSNSLFK